MSELSEETLERIRQNLVNEMKWADRIYSIPMGNIEKEPSTISSTEIYDKLLEIQKVLNTTNKMIKCEMPLCEPPKLVREVSEGIYPVYSIYYKPIKTISVINLEGVV